VVSSSLRRVASGGGSSWRSERQLMSELERTVTTGATERAIRSYVGTKSERTALSRLLMDSDPRSPGYSWTLHSQICASQSRASAAREKGRNGRRQRREDGGWLFVLSTANIDCQSILEWSLSPGFSYGRNPRQRLRFVEATSAAFHNPKSLSPVSSPTVCFFLRTPRSSDRFTSLLRRAPSAVPGVSTRQLLLLSILGALPFAQGRDARRPQSASRKARVRVVLPNAQEAAAATVP
jgi:hypothetical protein